MTNANRPNPGYGASPQEASAFSPFDASESSLGRLTEETVMRRGRMGDAFIKSGRLSRDQVDAIVQLQTSKGILFGEAAVKLGYLSPNEVEDVLDKQFNFNTPSGRRNGLIASSLAIVHAPYSEESEGIRRLRSQVLIKLGEHLSIALTIMSPLRREGKSHIAASLAIAFAQLNVKTMLIDGNLRAPTQHKLFGISNQTGLSTMLARRSPKTLESVASVMPSLWVLTSGPPPPNPNEILSPPNFSKLLDRFRDEISVFIVDTPAASSWADAETIARQTGKALLIGRENFTRLSDIRKMHHEMAGLGIDVLGTVYNQPPRTARGEMRSFWTRLTSPFQSIWSRISGRQKGGS